MSTMPEQKPHKSEQVVLTPPTILTDIKEELLKIGWFDYDLAADATNTVALKFFSEEDDAIIQSWKQGEGWNWCNPPYARLGPWVHKAWIESQAFGAKTAMLVPASVGSNWWREHVDGKAHVLFLSPRLTFVGKTTPYPKDCAILLYTPMVCGGYECWNWRQT